MPGNNVMDHPKAKAGMGAILGGGNRLQQLFLRFIPNAAIACDGNPDSAATSAAWLSCGADPDQNSSPRVCGVKGIGQHVPECFLYLFLQQFNLSTPTITPFDQNMFAGDLLGKGIHDRVQQRAEVGVMELLAAAIQAEGLLRDLRDANQFG